MVIRLRELAEQEVDDWVPAPATNDTRCKINYLRLTVRSEDHIAGASEVAVSHTPAMYLVQHVRKPVKELLRDGSFEVTQGNTIYVFDCDGVAVYSLNELRHTTEPIEADKSAALAAYQDRPDNESKQRVASPKVLYDGALAVNLDHAQVRPRPDGGPEERNGVLFYLGSSHDWGSGVGCQGSGGEVMSDEIPTVP